jgi:hypothetical protein
MFIWHRVFGVLEDEPDPAQLCAELARQGMDVRPAFRGDDQGWFEARLELIGRSSSLQVNRYLVREERMRGDLNSWCAWLETLPDGPARDSVLDSLVATTQIFTFFEDAVDEEASPACEILTRWLAERLGGVYQIDGQGFFDSSARLMVEESHDRARA